MTLVEFLEARIAEDEAVVRAAAARITEGLDWQFFTHGHYGYDDEDAVIEELWTLYGPARVLAECEAKRKVIAAALTVAEVIDGEWGCAHSADEIRQGAVPGGCYGPEQLGQLLGPLAAVYSSHPDFDPAWRVGGQQ